MKNRATITLVVLGVVGFLGFGMSGSWVAAQNGVVSGSAEFVMKRISKYKVVEGESRDALQEAVEAELDHVWLPVGGVTVDNGRYYQAMGQ